MSFNSYNPIANIYQWLGYVLTTLVTTLLVSISAIANEQTADSSVMSFELKPLACIAEYVGQDCLMVVAIKWQVNTAQSLCLKQRDVNIKCWQNKVKIEDKAKIKLHQSSEFSLIRQSDGTVLAKQKITVNYINKHRRRLKPQWSIF